jgi:hypothetical protein
VKQVTPDVVEGVALELELENQPFLVSAASLGGKDSHLRSSVDDVGMVSTFNRDFNGRQDR